MIKGVYNCYIDKYNVWIEKKKFREFIEFVFNLNYVENYSKYFILGCVC